MYVRSTKNAMGPRVIQTDLIITPNRQSFFYLLKGHSNGINFSDIFMNRLLLSYHSVFECFPNLLLHYDDF